MKDHFITLFDASHIWKTGLLFTIALLLMVVALSIGISDNLPAIALLFCGMVFLLFSILHPWKKTIYYATMIAVCGIILPLIFGNQTLGEFTDIAVGSICAVGIFTGITGIIIRLISNLRKSHGN